MIANTIPASARIVSLKEQNFARLIRKGGFYHDPKEKEASEDASVERVTHDDKAGNSIYGFMRERSIR